MTLKIIFTLERKLERSKTFNKTSALICKSTYINQRAKTTIKYICNFKTFQNITRILKLARDIKYNKAVKNKIH